MTLYDHPDEPFVTIIGEELTPAAALALDLNRKVVPWETLLEMAAYSKRHHPRAVLVQQFNCAGCGARQTIPAPDKLYIEGHCEECDAVTDLRKDGAWLLGLEPTAGKEAEFLAVFGDLAAKPDHYLTRRPPDET